MADLQPVKGTRDFYPQDMRLRNWLFDIWRRTAHRFGFEEYDACVLESEELYVRKAGDEITGQLYNFEDKGGRRIALRPEMTPSLARMILQRQKALNFPLKWFSIPQCFRYERMTRGRKREHYQWNMDIVGQAAQSAEVEIISALLSALQAMGLGSEHVVLHLNDRRLLNAVLDHLGVPQPAHLPVMVVMDKRDKVSPAQLGELLAEQGLAPVQVAGLNRILGMATLDALQGELGALPVLDDLRRLLELLERVGFGAYVAFDIAIVRGLSYYTGTVFEVRDRGAALRAICGGGRYDSLLSAYGGESIPAIGFGFGDVVILELLSDLGLLPTLRSDVDYAVIPFSGQQAEPAMELGQRLRQLGFSANADFSGRKLKRALQHADEIGARHALLLMPEEWARGEVVLRDMRSHTEARVAVDAFFEGLRSRPGQGA
ncbi:MAG: histidine--tRNA ligase [Candidatus Lambdaproteobacteria bacterium]|nr:histidine--tRNA ligase [Candidatus Lambdaproteobacteria bacterium]